MSSRDAGRNPRQVFGAMVRFYRERAGLSRSELARQICKSESLVQAIELGQRAATPQVTDDLDIPASVGAHEGLAGAFAVADFDGAPSVGYQEGSPGGHPVEEAKEVGALGLTWDTLRVDTLPRAASLELLEEAAKSWSSAA